MYMPIFVRAQDVECVLVFDGKQFVMDRVSVVGVRFRFGWAFFSCSFVVSRVREGRALGKIVAFFR